MEPSDPRGRELPKKSSLDSIQCVLVLYRTTLEQSESFQTLNAAMREHPSSAPRVSLLLYDNSPEPQSADLTATPFAEIRYHHDSANGGLAAAYNLAFRVAEERGCSWLWLFDQDTKVLPALIPALFEAIDSKQPSEVCAIVPRLVQDGFVYSPLRSERFRYRAVDERFSGIYPGWLTALNSCACLRVSALQTIGGFPPQYWLDYLDHAVFHRLHQCGCKVLVLDVTILHRLSTNNLGNESGHDRYNNVLAAEWRFVRETGWGGGTLMHRFRLLKRALRTLVTLRKPAFALQVFKLSFR